MSKRPAWSSSRSRRFKPITDPVTLLHDGRKIRAQRGEPVAVALLAAGRLLLARSPKLHRPRGPFCLRGACDGCLARVDGEPNIMTCLVRAEDGMRVETQNVLGARRADLLRATDYMFPQGFDHHRLLAGTPVLGAAMQHIARQVAGLGRVPESLPGGAGEPSHTAARARTPDVLIVGAGHSGAQVALQLKQRAPALELLLVDSAFEAGGCHALCEPERWQPLAERLQAAGVEVELESCVVGLYLRPEQARQPTALLSMPPCGSDSTRQLAVVHPRVVVLAVGGHDYVALFEGNDLPGIFSARAALYALRLGVLVGQNIVLVGGGAELEAFSAAAGAQAQITRVSEASMRRATGRSRVTGAVVQVEGEPQTLPADAIVVGGPRAPAFELAVQAGLAVRFQHDVGYIPVPQGYNIGPAQPSPAEPPADPSGSTAPTPVFLAGSVWREAAKTDGDGDTGAADDSQSTTHATGDDPVSSILGFLGVGG